MSLRALSLAGLLTLSPALAASQVLVGPEFRVNTYTTFSQRMPSAAADAAGNFLVVWESASQDGNGTACLPGWHEPTASRRRSRVPRERLDTGRSGTAGGGHPGGLFVVVWRARARTAAGLASSPGGTAAGRAPGAEFRVNTYTTGGQVGPGGGPGRAGNFVVGWQSAGADGNNFGIRARRFDAAGQAQGRSSRWTPTPRRRSGGRPWPRTPPGTRRGLAERPGPGQFRAASSPSDTTLRGRPSGGEYRVNTFTTNGQGSPVVGSDAAGNFVVVWISSDRTDPAATASAAGATTRPARRSAAVRLDSSRPATSSSSRPRSSRTADSPSCGKPGGWDGAACPDAFSTRRAFPTTGVPVQLVHRR